MPVGRGFDALRFDRRGAFGHPHCSGIVEEMSNDSLGAFVSTFTELMVPNAPLGVRDVERGPVLVPERVPNGVVVVDRDRVLDAHLPRGSTHALDVVLDVELRSVHADHDEAVRAVRLRPRA